MFLVKALGHKPLPPAQSYDGHKLDLCDHGSDRPLWRWPRRLCSYRFRIRAILVLVGCPLARREFAAASKTGKQDAKVSLAPAV